VKYFIAIFISILFIGCGQIPEGATYGQKVMKEDGTSLFKLNSVAILDKNLQRWEYVNNIVTPDKMSKIAIENYGIKTLETGNVQVFSTIRNRTDYPLQLSIRSQFYDDNKVSTENPTSWKRVFVPKNSLVTYKEQSISIGNVSNFLIEIKEGQ
jgi:uncharacterized protein YcfL